MSNKINQTAIFKQQSFVFKDFPQKIHEVNGRGGSACIYVFNQ